MAKESVCRVAEAEKKAEELEISAKAEKQKILNEAHQAAERILSDAENEAKEIIKSAKQKAENESKEAQTKAELEGNAKAAALKKRAADKFESAVDMVIEKLVD